MDKASIIKDAIEYIQELHEQERILQAEISELELKKNAFMEFDQETISYANSKPKRTRIHHHDHYSINGGSRSSPIEILEVSS